MRQDHAFDTDTDMQAEAVEPSRLQRAVEAIAITPAAAWQIVQGYRTSYEHRHGEAVSPEAKRRIAAKLIRRYAALAAASGAVTALPGVVPGVGTAVSVVGGGVADMAASLKIQIDLSMCLVELYSDGAGDRVMADEDKKHLAFVLALGGSLEQMISRSAKPAIMKMAEKLVVKYLSGATLISVKELFRRFAITFTQRAAAKAVPAGVGVAFAGSANYAMTVVVGKVAVAILSKDFR